MALSTVFAKVKASGADMTGDMGRVKRFIEAHELELRAQLVFDTFHVAHTVNANSAAAS